MRRRKDTVFEQALDGRIDAVSTHSSTNLAARFSINGPDVIAESIDGEVIIINLNSGAYYSSLGSGGAIWEALAASHSIEETIALLTTRYGVEQAAIEREISGFVAQLIDEGLLVESAQGGSPAAVEGGSGGVFETPVLSKYTDMQELLLLDPIHDVDPSAGWPFPKAAE